VWKRGEKVMADSYLLTPEERDRFALWLERQAEASKGITEQMEKLGLPLEVLQKEKVKMVACMVVAKMLHSVEDMNIGKPE